MAQTLAEKIICRAAGRESVVPGEIVTCRVDLAMVHDSSGPRRLAPMLERLGVGVWDPDRLVVITDHFVPAFDPASAAIQKLTQDWVAAAGVRNFHDMQGVCHIVLPERGHLRPGMFVVGGDSHSCTAGAFGCFMFGIGATDMAGVLRNLSSEESYACEPVPAHLLTLIADGGLIPHLERHFKSDSGKARP